VHRHEPHLGDRRPIHQHALVVAVRISREEEEELAEGGEVDCERRQPLPIPEEHFHRADAPPASIVIHEPVGILAGGVLFGLLLPISIGGVIGATVMCAIASVTAVGAGAGACKLVDRSARALFLREKGGGVPTARLLPAPKHR